MSALTIHWTPADGLTLTAACGQQIDGEQHTGHYASTFIRGLGGDSDRQFCASCANLLETP